MTFFLQSYLLANEAVPLPGLGLLTARQVPARYDVADRTFTVPDCQLLLQPIGEEEQPNLQPLLGYLAQKMNVSEEDAYEQLQQYMQQLNHSLQQGNVVDWAPVGHFSTSGEAIQFTPDFPTSAFASLKADRIIKKGVAHHMTVGDSETTSTAMEEYFQHDPKATDRWWLLPLLIAAIALLLVFLKKFGFLMTN